LCLIFNRIIIVAMDKGKTEHQTRRWSVTLTPHRSLTREGFVALMMIVVALNFVGGLVFLVAGAWPITGFMGLDVVLVWWAFRKNFADAQRAERIVVQDDLVTLHRLSQEGIRETLEFNRRWLRVELEFDEAREIVGRLLLSYRGALTEVGSFLGGDERQSLSRALRAALA
jgi:uncharacterized membrane protein